MKTSYYNKLIVLLLCSLLFFSCEKDAEMAVVQPGASSVLSSSANNVVLSMEDADKDAVTFTWTAADFGYQAAVRYNLEFDKKGNNFAQPKILRFDSTFMKTYKVVELNEIALGLALPQGAAGELEVRMRADVSSRVQSTFSNNVTITVTPYISEPPYPTIYMVGDAAEFDWDAGKATPMLRDETDPFIYTFTGYFDEGSLKFLAYLNQWTPMWGTNSSNEVVFRASSTDPDPWSFYVLAAGYYTVSLDLLRAAYKITSFDASSASTFDPIVITGTFNNWGGEAMTKTPKNPHLWSIEYTFASDTDLKFRNSNWSAQWGAANNHDRLYGKAVPAGNDDKVIVTAGTYRILFNDLTGHYVLIKK